MRQSFPDTETESAAERATPGRIEQSLSLKVVQIFVFNGDEYLGWDCFCREKVSIGSDASSDLVLKDEEVMPHHAEVRIDSNGDVLLTFHETGPSALRDATDNVRVVRPFDSVKIGPYTLKIKELRNKQEGAVISSGSDAVQQGDRSGDAHVNTELEQGQDHEEITDPVDEDSDLGHATQPEPEVLEGFSSKEAAHQEAQGEADAPARQVSETDAIGEDSHEEQILHEGFSEPQAPGLEEVSRSSDHQCRQEVTGGDIENDTKKLDEYGFEHASPCADLQGTGPISDFSTAFDHPVPEPSPEEEYEDDEDDIEADFCLRDRLTGENTERDTCTEEQGQFLIEVVKSRNGRVLDVIFLKQKQRSYIKTGKSRFCLAENKGPGGHYFYYDEHFSRIARSSYSDLADNERLCIHERLYNKKKGIYCDRLIPSSLVTIYDDPFEYHLRCVSPGKSPEVKEMKTGDNHYYRHFIKSTFLHIIALTIIGMFPSYTPQPENLQTHFVQVDPLQMEEINKRIAVPPPPKPRQEPPPAKSAPQPEAKKPEKPVKKQVTTPKKTAVASRSPKAGGGQGQGNVRTRNINQTGLLSMLGDNIGLKPQEAMAAVTNLDAVTSIEERTADFKVAGIVGKLGTARIEIPQSGIVSTKGSSQVLRSAGADGEGMVAALEKGVTGEGQVMAMVSAEMDRTVKIQGGMSREAVKKVIDEHIDEITYCYETALIANPSIMGKAVFEWKILLSGKVGEVRIKSSSINSSEIHSCIQQAIKSWQFPKPMGSEVLVSYPFIFDIVGF